jgi:hypothetical protein
LFIAEQIERDSEMIIGNSTAHYYLLGYRFGNWQPSVTYGKTERISPSIPQRPKNDYTAAALRYDAFDNIAFKLQWERTALQGDTWTNLLPNYLTDNEDYNIYTLSMDFVF